MQTGPASIFARKLLSNGVLLCVMLGVSSIWLLDGLVVPYRVEGGSMAEGLVGRHREVICGDCGYRFACDSDVLPASGKAVCPNCGYARNELASLPDVSGPRVLIDRSVSSLRRPRRWEVVALRQPSRSDQVVVKRIVGLPSETIEIRDGDMYINGKIAQKALAEQRALRMLVHDADFQPDRGPSRWQAEGRESRWTRADGRFEHASSTGTVDWLGYCDAITDACGYNQALVRRVEDVHVMSDLMLASEVGAVSGRGGFFVRVGDGQRGFEMCLEFDGPNEPVRYAVSGLDLPPDGAITEGRALGNALAGGEFGATDRARLVEVSLMDRQLLLAVDGETLACVPYERTTAPMATGSCRVAIGADSLRVAVRHLRLYRDVYYTTPPGVATRVVPLAADEYYVLGDNSPISDDSRIWEQQGVPERLLLGKPVVTIGSTELNLWGERYFQVPNPWAIRYIP